MGLYWDNGKENGNYYLEFRDRKMWGIWGLIKIYPNLGASTARIIENQRERRQDEMETKAIHSRGCQEPLNWNKLVG